MSVVPAGDVAGPLVVVGDLLLDVDLDGQATRLCPDAPVPVVDVGCRRRRPGGAGLAAMLAATGDVPVVLVSAVGQDPDGAALLDMLSGWIEVIGLPLAGSTVVKTRVAAADVPLLRLDTGDGRAARGPLPDAALDALRRAGAVLVCDYGRGITELAELRTELASVAKRTPVVWDPHPRGQPPVPGCRLVTPNAAEADRLSGRDGDDPEPAGVPSLVARWRADGVAVTMGDRGAVLTRRDSGSSPLLTTIVPVPADGSEVGRRTRIDTCGAGDQFAVAAALALRAGVNLGDAVDRAVAEAARFVRNGAAGSIWVDEPGGNAARPLASQPASDAYAVAERVRREGGRLVATGGCFDLLHVGHIELLAAARALGDALVVCLNSDASVRRAKGPDRPLVVQSDRARVLAALGAVDAVLIFDDDTPAHVLHDLRPDIWVKGADYQHQPMPEAQVVEQYGGQVRLLPLVSGYSTTSLVRHAARRLSPVSTPSHSSSQEVS